MGDSIRLDSVHIGDLARAAFQYMHEIGAHFGAKLGSSCWCTVSDQLWIVTARHDRHGLATYGVEVRPPGPIGDPVARLALERIGEPGVSATVSAFQEPPPLLFNGLVKRLGLLNDQPQGKGGAPRLENRLDWPAKVKTAQKWVDHWRGGRITQEAAATLLGYNADTLRDWARRAELIE